MSKSNRSPSRSARSNARDRSSTAPGPTYPEPPWTSHRINYGPAIIAIHELAAWAFDVAACGVVDWPDGQRRVSSARRFVLDRLRGRRVRRDAIDDVLFTAGLLARIFGDELNLDTSDMILVLDALGLPTEVVPLVPRSVPSARSVRPAPTPPITPLRPRPNAASQAAPCEECGHVHPVLEPRFRNAA